MVQDSGHMILPYYGRIVTWNYIIELSIGDNAADGKWYNYDLMTGKASM